MIMDEKVEYYKLPLYKRATALMMDFMTVFITFVLFAVLFASIIPNFMNKDEELKEYNSKRNVFIHNTDLYEIVDKEVVAIYEDDNITRSFEFSGHLDIYLKNKEESNLFIYENGQYIESGSKEELDKFYQNNWLIARKYIEQMDGYKYYNDLYQEKMATYTAIVYAVPSLISIIGLIMIVPFFNKDGKTLGKMLFKISVVNDDLEPLNRLQIFMRQFFFVLFIMLIIPSIISLIMFLFNEKGKTLHDYITLSRPIDSNVKKALLNRKKNNLKEEKKKDEFVFKDVK